MISPPDPGIMEVEGRLLGIPKPTFDTKATYRLVELNPFSNSLSFVALASISISPETKSKPLEPRATSPL